MPFLFLSLERKSSLFPTNVGLVASEILTVFATAVVLERLRQKGCHVIQAEGDADVDIVKAAVTMCISCSTTLVGEDTDLLILLLYYYNVNNRDLYFRSDKGKPTVYKVRVLKQLRCLY